jgi:transcriptional regulator with XRE-family HTH domain
MIKKLHNNPIKKGFIVPMTKKKINFSITPVDFHIGNKIKKFRTEKGISLAGLSKTLGISAQQLQKYENAQNRICANKLYEAAQLLEKPMEAFFDRLDSDKQYYNYNFKSEKSMKSKMSLENKQILPLIRGFNRIKSASVKKQIIKLVCEIAGPFYEKNKKHEFS